MDQADIEEFFGEFLIDIAKTERWLDIADLKKRYPAIELPNKNSRDEYIRIAKYWLKECIERGKYCWRYYEDKPPKDVKVKKQEDKFYYIKKKKKWWYKPRYDKAKALLDTLS